jgi:hypothetical protein
MSGILPPVKKSLKARDKTRKQEGFQKSTIMAHKRPIIVGPVVTFEIKLEVK